MFKKSLTASLKEGIKLSKRLDSKMREHGSTLYNALLNVLLLTIAFMVIAVIFNLLGWYGANITLSFVFLIVGIATFLHPELLITIANVDILNRALPEKIQMDAVDALFDTFIRVAKRLIALCCGIFLFLGIVPIGSNLKIFAVVFMSIIIIILINMEDNIATIKSERGRHA